MTGEDLDTVQAPTTPVLRGECNRCGRCCVVERDGKPYACTHLRHFQWIALGRPESTFCSVYDRRRHGMPITLRHQAGDEFEAVCVADGSPEETAVIIARGIGRGCSLEVVA